MAKETHFKPGQSGNPKAMFKPGNPYRWTPGQSGTSFLSWSSTATSGLGIHTYVGSKSLARFCCELLNLQHLAKSVCSKSVGPNEARTRQVLHTRIPQWTEREFEWPTTQILSLGNQAIRKRRSRPAILTDGLPGKLEILPENRGAD